MKRVTMPLDGLQSWSRASGLRRISSFLAESLNRPITCRAGRAIAYLAIAAGVGFNAAIWTVGLIVTAR